MVSDGEHVGRIYCANPHDKHGQNWYWGLNFFARPPDRAHLPGWDGYAESREEAMAAFRKAWDAMTA